jgi:hypothetical protein
MVTEMKQHFHCNACKSQSEVGGILHRKGVDYLVCMHCAAENKLMRFPPVLLGEPTRFTIAGVLSK